MTDKSCLDDLIGGRLVAVPKKFSDGRAKFVVEKDGKKYVLNCDSQDGCLVITTVENAKL